MAVSTSWHGYETSMGPPEVPTWTRAARTSKSVSSTLTITPASTKPATSTSSSRAESWAMAVRGDVEASALPVTETVLAFFAGGVAIEPPVEVEVAARRDARRVPI